jgi:hypothetical protein
MSLPTAVTRALWILDANLVVVCHARHGFRCVDCRVLARSEEALPGIQKAQMITPQEIATQSIDRYLQKEPQVIAKWDLENRFTYHPPRPGEAEQYTMIRSIAHSFATVLNEMCPDGHEKSLSITKLEEVVFWANAAIARSSTTKAEITQTNGNLS